MDNKLLVKRTNLTSFSEKSSFSWCPKRTCLKGLRVYIKAYLYFWENITFKKGIFVDNKVGAGKPNLSGWKENHYLGNDIFKEHVS